jgi:DNA-binding NarL/FixJ family response regulator
VLLAERDATRALAELTRSWRLWCDLGTPYEASCVRCLIGLAHRELGDEENALQELSAARETFQHLGASVDLRRTEALLPKKSGLAAGPLTDRELQVLRLVAGGLSNRLIAAKLKISEKTVARHLSNIFTKLDLPSRTAATAYAYERNLV